MSLYPREFDLDALKAAHQRAVRYPAVADRDVRMGAEMALGLRDQLRLLIAALDGRGVLRLLLHQDRTREGATARVIRDSARIAGYSLLHFDPPIMDDDEKETT